MLWVLQYDNHFSLFHFLYEFSVSHTFRASVGSFSYVRVWWDQKKKECKSSLHIKLYRKKREQLNAHDIMCIDFVHENMVRMWHLWYTLAWLFHIIYTFSIHFDTHTQKRTHATHTVMCTHISKAFVLQKRSRKPLTFSHSIFTHKEMRCY